MNQTLHISFYRFYLDVKENVRGRFIKIAETLNHCFPVGIDLVQFILVALFVMMPFSVNYFYYNGRLQKENSQTELKKLID